MKYLSMMRDGSGNIVDEKSLEDESSYAVDFIKQIYPHHKNVEVISDRGNIIKFPLSSVPPVSVNLMKVDWDKEMVVDVNLTE